MAARPISNRNIAERSSSTMPGTDERQQEADQGDLPGRQMNPGDEGAERQQRQHRQGAGLGGHHPRRVGEIDQLHRRQHRAPMQRLGPDQPPAVLPLDRVRPGGGDADDAYDRRQHHPIGADRRIRETGVADPDQQQRQHQQIGPLLQQKAPARRRRRGNRVVMIGKVDHRRAHRCCCSKSSRNFGFGSTAPPRRLGILW